MATIVLSAVGAAAGAGIGGGVLGMSSAVVGRAVGASIGRAIDQRLFGAGSDAIETGRVERFRVSGAGEGQDIAQVFGRMRIGGQVIWASRFKQSTTTTGGGKGAPSQPKTTSYSYSVSLALALCEGEITRVGRIWADGQEIARDSLNLRVYQGKNDQLPDPKIEALEGAGNVPAYRGLAYVVIEDLDLGRFGNRVPQLSFEVVRGAQPGDALAASDLATAINAVALIPGTGEYSLATTPVFYKQGLGKHRAANVNSPSGKTDFATSIEALTEELPNVGSVSLVVSWFGDDLRCDQASLRPKVEQSQFDGQAMPWRVSGIDRATAALVPKDVQGNVIYGGTPCDASVREAIAEMTALGRDVVFYPFILMDQQAGNGLTDPWSGQGEQPALPWRGRITTSLAPQVAGTPDRTAAAAGEVDAFFGAAQPGDFTVSGDSVVYSGPPEWSYRRFILHYAHLCAAAGGVDAFCIGSEMRGLTQIRGANDTFPAVDALIQLAADVRQILGAGTKIGYAADWTEYFGYHPQDGSGDVYFHLDPLWADAEIDFVGIDNYQPLSDWRDGADHADAGWGSIYSLDYLKANIEGGEGYDWYYANQAARDSQNRSAISDGAYGEPWVFRYKDIRSWWQNAHYARAGGVRDTQPTPWVPQSKPIWFTEIGCAAIDKGTNQPNKFVDDKSSESALPHFSNGQRDDLIQMQYLAALTSYWNEPGQNPVSAEYDGPMLDMSRAHVWAWDCRPYPYFPHKSDLWSDSENYTRGHWLNGRASARSLAGVLAEVCKRSGLTDVDVEGAYGVVRGYLVDEQSTARAALQPLLLAYGLDAVERDGKVLFKNRDGRILSSVTHDGLALVREQETALVFSRDPDSEDIERLRLGFVGSEDDYELNFEEAVFSDVRGGTVSQSTVPLILTRQEARAIVERWLAEARIARDAVQFSLPPSQLGLGAGDIVALDDVDGSVAYRIDRVTQAEGHLISAVRIEPEVYIPAAQDEAQTGLRPFTPPAPVGSVFLDLPLISGAEIAHAPHVAFVADPWPGSVAVYSAPSDNNYQVVGSFAAESVIGMTETNMPPARGSLWDNSAPLRVVLESGALASASRIDVLNGANLAAIGDEASGNWEVIQFVDAQLVAPNTYELSTLLRGQFGTDALVASDWPPGSTFVLLDGSPAQIDMTLGARGLERYFRVGPEGQPYTDPSFTTRLLAFDGVGLRPLAPVHLRARANGADWNISWVRRTRLDGDNWQSFDVPLGEDAQTFVVQVWVGANLLREELTAVPDWTYAAAMINADGASGSVTIAVAQISAQFGAGLFRKVQINV